MPAAAAGPEAVTNFSQSANLARSGTLSVTDDIEYDFGSATPHIINYKIPLSYHDNQGRDYRVNFKLIESRMDGQPVSLSPNVTATTAQLSLPAGPAASATRSYAIKYSLAPVVLQGITTDNFKLSVTGLGWAVPINKASLRLETHTAPADNFTCFTGAQGGTTSSCTVAQSGNITNVVSYAELKPGDSLSIFTDFPQKSFDSYLQTHETKLFTPGLIAGLASGVVAITLGFLGLRAAWRRRARAIVEPGARDYTKINESAQDQAHRK